MPPSPRPRGASSACDARKLNRRRKGRKENKRGRMDARRAFADFFMHQPEFERWKASNPHHDDWGVYEAYEHINARISTIMYALGLLWPNFVEHDNLLLRDTKGRSAEEWDTFLQQFRELSWTNAQIEYVVNHLHLSQDTFTADPDREKIDNSVWLPLAHTVAAIWQCRLNELFPGRQSTVWSCPGWVDSDRLRD
jgi:hypothetical protein